MTRGARWLALAVLLACAVPGAPARAESLRCGVHLVRTGDTKLDVIEKCGEPALREVISGSDERRVEEWYYRESVQKFPRVLTFEGLRLVSIKTLSRTGSFD